MHAHCTRHFHRRLCVVVHAVVVPKPGKYISTIAMKCFSPGPKQQRLIIKCDSEKLLIQKGGRRSLSVKGTI